MLTVQSLPDHNGRTTISYSSVSPDRSRGWQFSLTTPDIPPLFLNSKPEERDLEVSIVDATDWVPGDHPDSILLPVAIVSTSNVAGKIKTFYRQRSDVQSKLSPVLALECFVTQGDEAAGDLKDPHILLCFKVKNMTDNTNSSGFGDPVAIKGNDQSTDNVADTRSQDATQRAHVDKNENANGGLDLPVGDAKSDAEEQNRDNAKFDYDNIDKNGKVGSTTDATQDA